MFPCTLFVPKRHAHVLKTTIRMYTDEKPLSACVRYSSGYGRIARSCVNAIGAFSDEEPVFACMLFVRLRTNCLCLRVCYSCVCGRIARVYVYSIPADANE